MTSTETSGFKATYLRMVRSIYRPLGFKKGYNFPLFVITIGALMGFTLARFQYLDISGTFEPNTIPGEQWVYRRGNYQRIAIILHLATVLPGAFLACLQFVPIIRHKAILFHRLNGYLVVLLAITSNASAFMLIKDAVGGAPIMQVLIGVIGGMSTLYLFLAIYNIWRLQIDLHRAYMIRAWTLFGTIITERLFNMAANHAITTYQIHYFAAIPCAQIFHMYTFFGAPDLGNPVPLLYPTCGSAEVAKTNLTPVLVDTIGSGPENVAAQFRVAFPTAWFVALVLHVGLTELYLWLTPAENHRLRVLSYEKQVKKGIRGPGVGKAAGLGASRFGDAPKWWDLPEEEWDAIRAEARRAGSESEDQLK